MDGIRKRSLWHDFIRVITFLDLPIRRKFFLFFLGTLFWFLVMAAIALATLFSIEGYYHHIVDHAIPHDRVVQKIVRNLHEIAGDTNEIVQGSNVPAVLRRTEIARQRLEDLRGFISALALGGEIADVDRDTGRPLESFRTTTVASAEGTEFLKRLSERAEGIGHGLETLSDLRLQALQHPPGDDKLLAETVDNLQERIFAASDLTVAFTTAAINRYEADAQIISQRILFTAIALTAILFIAVFLLGIFTRWISAAIAEPIQAIVNQIHAVGSGDVDLTNRIAITSRDEIGTLSSEFNALMETVHRMTTFKKVIEEDATLEEVYARLGQAFREEAGIDRFMLYEVEENQQEMRAVYPLPAAEGKIECHPDILSHGDLCRAKKTGHTVSSLAYARVCRIFPETKGMAHVCVPMIIGGRTGGVAQFLFAPPENGRIDNQEVHPRVFKAEAYLKQALSVIEAKRLMSTLRRSALRDPLTGLYNRRFLQEHGDHIIAGIRRRQTHLGLVMCDLDYFKQVNDQHGHDAGDQVLKETALLIRSCVRESDIVIRFGGEEFLILLVDIRPGEGAAVAEKIRAAIEEHPIRLAGGTLKKTISLGVSEFPADSEAVWQAIKYADVALYRAKENGRNQVVRFETTMWSNTEF